MLLFPGGWILPERYVFFSLFVHYEHIVILFSVLFSVIASSSERVSFPALIAQKSFFNLMATTSNVMESNPTPFFIWHAPWRNWIFQYTFDFILFAWGSFTKSITFPWIFEYFNSTLIIIIGHIMSLIIWIIGQITCIMWRSNSEIPTTFLLTQFNWLNMVVLSVFKLDREFINKIIIMTYKICRSWPLAHLLYSVLSTLGVFKSLMHCLEWRWSLRYLCLWLWACWLWHFVLQHLIFLLIHFHFFNMEAL